MDTNLGMRDGFLIQVPDRASYSQRVHSSDDQIVMMRRVK